MGNGKQVAGAMQHYEGEDAFVVERLKSIDLVRYNGAVVEAQEFERNLRVNSDEIASKAIDYLSVMKKSAKTAEDERKRILEPFAEFTKRVNNLFRPISDGFVEVEGLIKRKVLAYQNEKERVLAERQRQLEEEHRKAVAKEEKRAEKKGVEPKYVPPPLAPEPVASTVSGSVGSGTAKQVWKFELVDISKVPVQFLELNGVAVNGAIRGGVREIPGLRIYPDKQLSVK